MEQKEYWPGWETVRKLGNGSYGAVYEIQRDLFGTVEKAALKVLHIPQNESDVEELRLSGYDDRSITAHFKECLADIVREYTFMSQMKGHTNVIYCDDVRCIQQENGFGWDIYIKMELLAPLPRALGREFDEGQVIRLGKDLCTALVLCKGKSIVHRDIKPQNIFVSETGDYKLGDFGIARTMEQTTGGTKIGTYNYMAPEVYNNQPYGAASDIYSLGLVMYWLLNGRRLPFLPLPPETPTSAEFDRARLRRFSGEPLPEPVSGSPELKRIVLKACAYDPRDRYTDPQEMLQILNLLETSSIEEEEDECTTLNEDWIVPSQQYAADHAEESAFLSPSIREYLFSVVKAGIMSVCGKIRTKEFIIILGIVLAVLLAFGCVTAVILFVLKVLM